MSNEFPCRKNLRLKEYNYAQNGAYYVTICVNDRLQILSTVGADAHGGPNLNVELTVTGKMVEKYISNINTVYEHVTVDTCVIMPDHVHLILMIDCPNGSPRAATPTVSIPQIMNSLKTLTSKAFGRTLWQRNYYEKIIRSEKELQEVRTYIMNNPLRKWLRQKNREEC